MSPRIPQPTDDSDGQIVRRPRTTDAIGLALRSTFGQLPAVPHDMAMLLQRLDTKLPAPR